MTAPGQPAPVSPDLECTACAPGVTSPHGVPATPGRAAYEALHASLLARNPDHNHVPWGELDELTRHADGWYRADFEAAAIAAAPQPAPELAAAMRETRILRDSLIEAVEIARDARPLSAAGQRARKANLDNIARRCGLPS